MKVAYLGFSPDMVQYIGKSHYFHLAVCFCEERFLNAAIKTACAEDAVPLEIIQNERDIEACRARYAIDLFIVYKTSIIIHKPLLDKYSFYNFHPGSLETNRGANPLVWTILLGFDKAMLSLHKMEMSVDCGLCIDTASVAVADTDSTVDIEKKLNITIPRLLLRLESYCKGEFAASPIYGGIYRSKVKALDYTINFNNDSDVVITRKIRSQLAYNGAILPLDEGNIRVPAVRIVKGDAVYDAAPHEYVLYKNKKTYIFTVL